jgi:ribosomal protein S12 methylthiotransferase
MQHQQAISTRRLKEKIGKRLSVIIDKAEPRQAEGRTKGDAPGIDGKVHISSHRPLRVGDIVSVKIEHSDAYDLYGLVV